MKIGDGIKKTEGGSAMSENKNFGYEKKGGNYIKKIEIIVPGDVSKYRMTQSNDPAQERGDMFCGHPAYWAPWNLPEGRKNADGTYTIEVTLEIDKSYFEPRGAEGSAARKNFGALTQDHINKFENFVKDACKENPTVVSAELSRAKIIYLTGPATFTLRQVGVADEKQHLPLTIKQINLPASIAFDDDKKTYGLAMEIISYGGISLIDKDEFKAASNKQKYLELARNKARAESLNQLYDTALALRDKGKLTDAAYLFKIIFREFKKDIDEQHKTGQLSVKDKESFVNLCFAAGKTHHLKREFIKAAGSMSNVGI